MISGFLAMAYNVCGYTQLRLLERIFSITKDEVSKKNVLLPQEQQLCVAAVGGSWNVKHLDK